MKPLLPLFLSLFLSTSIYACDNPEDKAIAGYQILNNRPTLLFDHILNNLDMSSSNWVSSFEGHLRQILTKEILDIRQLRLIKNITSRLAADQKISPNYSRQLEVILNFIEKNSSPDTNNDFVVLFKEKIPASRWPDLINLKTQLSVKHYYLRDCSPSYSSVRIGALPLAEKKSIQKIKKDIRPTDSVTKPEFIKESHRSRRLE